MQLWFHSPALTQISRRHTLTTCLRSQPAPSSVQIELKTKGTHITAAGTSSANSPTSPLHPAQQREDFFCSDVLVLKVNMSNIPWVEQNSSLMTEQKPHQTIFPPQWKSPPKAEHLETLQPSGCVSTALFVLPEQKLSCSHHGTHRAG